MQTAPAALPVAIFNLQTKSKCQNVDKEKQNSLEILQA